MAAVRFIICNSWAELEVSLDRCHWPIGIQLYVHGTFQVNKLVYKRKVESIAKDNDKDVAVSFRFSCQNAACDLHTLPL